MKNIIKSILVIFLLSSVSNAEYCNSNFDCDISKNDKTGETVFDVLGWINKTVDNLDNVNGLVTGYNKTINKYALLGN